MASSATMSYVGLVEQPETMLLKGAAAQRPLTAGQTIVGVGTYTDGSPTGPGIFLVLRQSGPLEFVLAPLGTNDGDWSRWLSSRSSVKTLLWRDSKEAVPEEQELLRRWCVMGEKDVEPQKKDYLSFGKKIAEEIGEKWLFLNDLVVSDRPPPQAVTVPFYR